jgi:hypothetical protein
MTGSVVSPGILETAGDQTAPFETPGADSGDSSASPILRALVHLSETMIMLASEGELGHARAVHEAIGQLLTRQGSAPRERDPSKLAERSGECR